VNDHSASAGHAVAAGETGPLAVSPALALTCRLAPGFTAAAALFVIAVLGVLGGLEQGTSARLGMFDLDVEGTVSTAFSSLLLFVAAGMAYLLASVPFDPFPERLATLALAGVLWFMGIDEGIRLHEEVDAAVGLDWQLLYAPAVVLAAWAGWRVWGLLDRIGAGRGALLGGAAAWVLSQLLELVQFEGELRPGIIDAEHLSDAEFAEATRELWYVLASTSEEVLEMGGSLLFGLALLLALRRIAGRQPPAT
jgi:hypothetical protein